MLWGALLAMPLGRAAGCVLKIAEQRSERAKKAAAERDGAVGGRVAPDEHDGRDA